MKTQEKTFEELDTIIDDEGNKFIIISKGGLIPGEGESSYTYAAIENNSLILHRSIKEMESGKFKIYKTSQAEYKKSINVLKEYYQKIENNYEKLKYSCPHNIISKYESAVCEICEKDYGWYCPDSPDNTCHYHSDNGRIQLINGAIITMPPSYDSKNESYDWCAFCGDPDERK